MSMSRLVSVLMPCHRDAHLVRLSLPRILERSHVDLEVLLLNNDLRQKEEIGAFARELADERVGVLELEHAAGFAKAINAGIRASRGDLVFFANSDLFVGDGYLDELASLFSRRPRAGASTGKLLRYDLDTGIQTNVIDSTGHVIRRNRRVSDRGENEQDVGQFEWEEEVFSVSGAALVASRAALESVAIAGEYLDESFGAYKEDIDLCWRLRLAGWECWYVPTAVAHHARTSHGLGGQNYLGAPRAFVRNERSKPAHVRANSMKNQWLMLVKNDDRSNLLKDAVRVLGRESLVLVYNIAVAPIASTRTLRAFLGALPGARGKRLEIKRRQAVSPQQIRRWFGVQHASRREAA
jgi:GT2 family glycosyltransferase